LNQLDQDDSELIEFARKRFLVPPNDQDVSEYYLDRPNVTDPSDGLALTVIGLLGNMVIFHTHCLKMIVKTLN